MHVSLFVTCVVDLFSPEVGVAAVRVMRAMDVDVGVPQGQTCCGQPAWNSGFHRDAARVAAASLKALGAALDEHPDSWIVVPAGSCATMIRIFWSEMFELTHDHERAAQARRVAERTLEFSEFVHRFGDRLPGLTGNSGGPVGYHHSCHMYRELRITEAPTDLLGRCGDTLVEWSADSRCCGFGGLFSFKLPETSEAMADNKLSTLAATGCRTIVGCDTSCLLHLEARAEHEGAPVKIRHLAEVLADTLPVSSTPATTPTGATGQ